MLMGACGEAAPVTQAIPASVAPIQSTPNEQDLAEQIATWQAQVSPSAPTQTESAPAVSTSTTTPSSTAISPASPDDWQSAPIVPAGLSDAAINIYLNGLQMGRDSSAFSKVGDCGGTPSWFLGAFEYPAERGLYRLGEYAYLAPLFDAFPGSFERYSMAVSPGFNASSIFSSLWADPQQCSPGEGPLQCEFRLHNPSIALIMLGTNDYVRPEQFEGAMREIIQYSIDNGVLPILASKLDNLEGDGSINRTIYQLAIEFQLPFWNFWRAAQPLPNHGLQDDGAHLTWAPNFFDDPQAMQAAWPWRNLTALMALNLVWGQLPK